MAKINEISDKFATEVAQCLNNKLLPYGIPESVITDIFIAITAAAVTLSMETSALAIDDLTNEFLKRVKEA